MPDAVLAAAVAAAVETFDRETLPAKFPQRDGTVPLRCTRSSGGNWLERILFAGIVAMGSCFLGAADFERLRFNNPKAVVDLKAGYAGDDFWVGDFDGDGRRDLLVYSGWQGAVWAGWWFCRNPTPAGRHECDPVFESPRRVAPPTGFVPPESFGRDCVDQEGRPIVVPADYAVKRGTYERRLLVDFNGDGLEDLVICAGGREMDYAETSGFDAHGEWTRVQTRGNVWWCRRLSGTPTRYAAPELVRLENGAPIGSEWWPLASFADFDGDGDLDIVLQNFMEDLVYFENIGTRKNPVYTAGRFLRSPDGARLTGYHCVCTTKACDWDGDGRMDLMRSEEGGNVCWYRNTGRIVDRLPVFDRARFFRQRADELGVNALVTPFVADLDGDGDEDILCGTATGTLELFENLSGPGIRAPKFAPPRRVTLPDGSIFRIVAGPKGSIQGPCERMFGYTCPTVADWNGDGLKDIVLNSVLGRIVWLRNIGTSRRPAYDFPREIEVEWGSGGQPELAWHWLKPRMLEHPKALLVPWRTTPVAIDFNRDGLVDLVLSDHDCDLAFYERFRRADGTLALKPPRKAFLDQDRKPIWGSPARRFRPGFGGVSGRRKFCFCDWNGDGLPDLVMNGTRNVELWLQEPGDGTTWSFRCAKELGELNLSSHEPQPASCDFDGNGIPDLILGVIDGYLYGLRNPRADK